MIERQCGRCHRVKEIGSFPLRKRKHADGTEIETHRSICKYCFNIRRDAYPRTPQPKADGQRKGGKDCPQCAGLSWRIRGPKCRGCGELYADEAPVELVFRRHYEWTVAC